MEVGWLKLCTSRISRKYGEMSENDSVTPRPQLISCIINTRHAPQQTQAQVKSVNDSKNGINSFSFLSLFYLQTTNSDLYTWHVKTWALFQAKTRITFDDQELKCPTEEDKDIKSEQNQLSFILPGYSVDNCVLSSSFWCSHIWCFSTGSIWDIK